MIRKLTGIRKYTEYMGGHLNWKGEWVPEESPFSRAGEYSLQKDLVTELFAVTSRYQGRIKDQTIAEALKTVLKKYQTE